MQPMTLRKSLLFFLILFLLFAQSFAGGKKKTVYTYITEQWTERDFFGSGLHMVTDKIRPNISMLVHKVDGEKTDLVGVPNSAQAGEPSLMKPAPFGPYDPLFLLSRIDTTKDVTARKYGDWTNDMALWDPAANLRDANNRNFMELLPEMNGEKGTRYRFTVYVEDNTPFWFKNEGGPVLYFPYQLVIFRITEASGGTDMADAFEETGIKDELCIVKKTDELRLSFTPEEHRLRGGRHVFNFVVYHNFKMATDYILMVSARDIEGNERVMRVPISMDPLSGIQLENRSVQTDRYED